VGHSVDEAGDFVLPSASSSSQWSGGSSFVASSVQFAGRIKRGVAQGLTFSNELISRDEGLHYELGIQAPEQDSREFGTGAVESECESICDARSCGLVGMRIELPTRCIGFVADRLFTCLGHLIFSARTTHSFGRNLVACWGKRLSSRSVSDCAREPVFVRL